MTDKQTQNKHKQHNENGGFAKGNTLGNRWQKVNQAIQMVGVMLTLI